MEVYYSSKRISRILCAKVAENFGLIICERGVNMNIRKNIDYSQMYEAIDEVMLQNLPQMQLYCSIGKIVCTRSEKGSGCYGI